METVKIHQTQIKKLQRYTLSKDFIVKLRDSALAAHEKGKILTEDETILALKREIEQLKEQVRIQFELHLIRMSYFTFNFNLVDMKFTHYGTWRIF